MNARPLCFILMPFGKKTDPSGSVVDFDAVYAQLIAPAVEQAGLAPLRADEDPTYTFLNKAGFEKLVLCEYAVADLTTARPGIFYELGVRHAVRPQTTVVLFAEGLRLPVDVRPLRALAYRLNSVGRPEGVEWSRRELTGRLREGRATGPDSPVFRLVEGMQALEIDPARTEPFQDRVRQAAELRQRLTAAREEGVHAVRRVQEELGELAQADAGLVIELFLVYRALRAWDDMIALVAKMSPVQAETVLVQEQLALALNRRGQSEQAERVLKELLERRGPSSETYGILGRVYKDCWESARDRGEASLARGWLEKAIDAYTRGFEADWRDAYPGINAVTLMEIGEPPDPKREQLLPVVRYAVERRIARGRPDYWDYATRLELAVLGMDEKGAWRALREALTSVREPWEPETTARNLRLIREARERRGRAAPWMSDIENALGRSS